MAGGTMTDQSGDGNPYGLRFAVLWLLAATIALLATLALAGVLPP